MINEILIMLPIAIATSCVALFFIVKRAYRIAIIGK